MLVSLNRVKKKHRLFTWFEKGIYEAKDFSLDEWFLRQYYGYSVTNSIPKLMPLLKESGLRPFGVADSIEQVKAYYEPLESLSEQFFIMVTPVYRKEQSSPFGGFRFHKWGKYIGKHDIRHEYLCDEKDMDMVYTFRVLILESGKHRPARREHITRVKSLLN